VPITRQTNLHQYHNTAPLANRLARLMSTAAADPQNQSGSDQDADMQKKSGKSRPKKPSSSKKPAGAKKTPAEPLSTALLELQMERLKLYPKEPMTLEEATKIKCAELDKQLDLPQSLAALTGEYSSMRVASEPKHTPIPDKDARTDAEAKFYQQQDFTVLVHTKTGQDVFLVDAKLFTWVPVTRRSDKYNGSDAGTAVLQKLSHVLMRKVQCFKGMGECSSKEDRLARHRGLVPFLLLQESVKGRSRGTKKAAGGGGGASTDDAGADEGGSDDDAPEEPMVVTNTKATTTTSSKATKASVPMDDMPTLSATAPVPMEAVSSKHSAGAITAPVVSSVLERLKGHPASKLAAATEAAEAQIHDRIQRSQTIHDVVAAKMLGSNMLPRADATPEHDKEKGIAFQNKCNSVADAVSKLDKNSIEFQAAQFYLSADPPSKEQTESKAYKLVFFPIAVAGAKAALRMWHEPAVRDYTQALKDTKQACQAYLDQMKKECDDSITQARKDADHYRTQLHELEKVHKQLVTKRPAPTDDTAVVPPPNKKAAKSAPPSPAKSTVAVAPPPGPSVATDDDY
jgi:hypothetical protein